MASTIYLKVTTMTILPNQTIVSAVVLDEFVREARVIHSQQFRNIFHGAADQQEVQFESNAHIALAS